MANNEAFVIQNLKSKCTGMTCGNSLESKLGKRGKIWRALQKSEVNTVFARFNSEILGIFSSQVLDWSQDMAYQIRS